MATNDYNAILYYILKYLYECLKTDTKPDEEVLNLSLYKGDIGEKYRLYVYKNLYEDGYIKGIEIIELKRLGDGGSVEFIKDYRGIEITPKGIEYLEENSFIKKAYEVVKDFKPW